MCSDKKALDCSPLTSDDIHEVVDIDDQANTESIMMSTGGTDLASAGGIIEWTGVHGAPFLRERLALRCTGFCAKTCAHRENKPLTACLAAKESLPQHAAIAA